MCIRFLKSLSLSAGLLWAITGSAHRFPHTVTPQADEIANQHAPLITTSGILALGGATPRVMVGPGAAESSIRQVVRTLSGRVYIAALDDDGTTANCFHNDTVFRMYKSTTTGIPTAFTEKDANSSFRAKTFAGTAPCGQPTTGRTMSGGEARIDASGIIHTVYYRGDTGATVYQTFDTNTDTWNAAEELPNTRQYGNSSNEWFGARGTVLNGLALDRTGIPYVAITNGGLRVFRKELVGGWILDATLTTTYGIHPSLSFDRQNRLHVAWLENDRFIKYTQRSASGTWLTTIETIATGNANPLTPNNPVLSNQNLDQAPSLAVDANDNPVVLYLSGIPNGSDDTTRIKYRVGTNWLSDDPNVYTHTPALYLRGDDRYVVLGHDGNKNPAYLTRSGVAGSAWSDQVVFLPTGQYDGSASIRFDPQYEVDCTVIDVLYFDEDSDTPGRQWMFKPDLFYTAITLNGPTSGDGSCREINGPTVAITSQPTNPTTSTSASFTWSTTGTVTTTQCKLDAGAYATCASPMSYSGLALGSHTFYVQVSNASGSNTATSTWTINALTAPTVSITNPPANSTSTSANLTWTTTGTVTTMQCKLDTGTYAACTSPKPYTSLAVGTHTFSVQVSNAAGSNTATATWTINALTAPTVSITNPPANSTSTSANLTWTTTGTVTTTQCKLDAGAYAACTSPKAYTSLAVGTHTFSVQVSNAAGSNTATATWTINALTAPTVSITNPPANSTSTSANLTWTTTGTVTTMQCKLDTGTYAACTSPKPYTLLAVGMHTFYVQVSNAAGSNTATASWTISSTTAPPTVTITPASKPSNPTSDTSANLAWTTTGTVTSRQCSLDGAAFAACTTPKAYSMLAVGSHTFQVQVSNTAGSNTASYTWTVIAPLFGTTTITSNPDSNAMGMAEAFQITTSATASGSLSKLQVFVDASSTTGAMVAGLYTDAVDGSGIHKPGTLLSQGSLTAPAKNAWNTVTIPAVSVTPGTAYWVAILGTQSGKLYFRDTSSSSGNCKCQTSNQSTLTALPSTWTTGTIFDDCPLSTYGMP